MSILFICTQKGKNTLLAKKLLKVVTRVRIHGCIKAKTGDKAFLPRQVIIGLMYGGVPRFTLIRASSMAGSSVSVH